MSPPRVIWPRVLPSTDVTPFRRYYDPSDFLAVISAFSLGPLVCRYFPPWKNDEDLPRSPRCSGYMPCSLTPEVSSPPAHERWSGWCLRAFGHPRPPRQSVLTGLNRFSHTAYGLHPPCLRLTHAVTGVRPRLGMECVGSTLFQSHLQRQATVRFVAHPKLTVRVPPGESTRRSTLSREEASSGKILMKDHACPRSGKFCSRPSRHSFRESCRTHRSRNGVEHHRRIQFHW